MELGMNHAGEISTLVAIAEPEVRVWTNVGDAHLGFFASADAIADAKAEILEGAGADDAAGVQCGRPARHGARGGVCRASRDVRRVGGATVRAARRRGPRRRRHARDVVTPRGDGTHRDAAARARQSVERARRRPPWRSSSACRSTTSRDACAPAAGRSARRRRRLRATASRSIDDSYNSSPAALTRALETLAPRRARHGRDRGARRDARARRPRRWRCTRSVRARGGRRRRDAAVRRRRRAGARRWPMRPSTAGMPAVGRALFRARARRRRRRRRGDRARRSRARQGLARHRHRRRGRSPRGGARLMLYYLLPPLATPYRSGVAERHAVHHVPDGGGEPDRAGRSAWCSARG